MSINVLVGPPAYNKAQVPTKLPSETLFPITLVIEGDQPIWISAAQPDKLHLSTRLQQEHFLPKFKAAEPHDYGRMIMQSLATGHAGAVTCTKYSANAHLYNSSVVGAAAFCTVMAAVPAAAQTAATFDFTTGTRAETTGSLTYTVGGVSVIATAYHFNDNSGTTAGTVVSATLGNYVPDGLGVRYGSDPSDTTGTNGKGGNDTTGTHQIDNVGGGVDFIALQFSQAVTLTQIGRTAFDLAGVSTRDDDASIYGFNSTAAYGALNLTGQTFAYGLFTDLSGSGTSSNGGSDTKTVTGTGANNVYLIAANVGSGDRDDGFKLNGVNVSYSPVAPVVAAAPEPATWSMMIAGFGGVGLAMRRRKDGKRVAATA